MDDDPRGVVLSWREPPHDLSRPLDGYYIYYNAEGESTQEVPGNCVQLHVILHLLIRLNSVLVILSFRSLHCFLVKLIKCLYKLLTRLGIVSLSP